MKNSKINSTKSVILNQGHRVLSKLSLSKAKNTPRPCGAPLSRGEGLGAKAHIPLLRGVARTTQSGETGCVPNRGIATILLRFDCPDFASSLRAFLRFARPIKQIPPDSTRQAAAFQTAGSIELMKTLGGKGVGWRRSQIRKATGDFILPGRELTKHREHTRFKLWVRSLLGMKEEHGDDGVEDDGVDA